MNQAQAARLLRDAGAVDAAVELYYSRTEGEALSWLLPWTALSVTVFHCVLEASP